ncbi:hypothetical protein L1887_17679 [Cichorium endivia]|nr:hypothetical protein L1887_17679 [Cichorium endivia]
MTALERQAEARAATAKRSTVRVTREASEMAKHLLRRIDPPSSPYRIVLLPFNFLSLITAIRSIFPFLYFWLQSNTEREKESGKMDSESSETEEIGGTRRGGGGDRSLGRSRVAARLSVVVPCEFLLVHVSVNTWTYLEDHLG